MGDKGAKASPAGQQAAEALAKDLEPLGGVSTKKMFGGHGVFAEGVMFALVDSGGGCFLRANDATSDRFINAGSERHGKMPYWAIPDDIRADGPRLLDWARGSLEVARAAKK